VLFPEQVITGNYPSRNRQVFAELSNSATDEPKITNRSACVHWLLIVHDRVQGDTFNLTQEIISYMLGTPRTGVTMAAGTLQDAGLIRYKRGKITIVDRPGLEQAACECYRIVAHILGHFLDA
jgi:hypothetical protein